MKIAFVFLTCTCILLLSGLTKACEECLVYQRLSSDCPCQLSNPMPNPVTSESECVLLCTLRRDCQLSAYLTESATCYSLGVAASTAACDSGVVVRRKRQATKDESSMSSFPSSFVSNVLLWFNFRKGYDNLANPSLYAATPQNVVSQDAVNGVKLAGASNSFVSVSTPGFYRNFLAGRKFSFFFQGYFIMDWSTDKCFSSFSDGESSSSTSYFNTRNNGGIHSRTYFVDGTSKQYASVTSQPAIPRDSVRRILSFGVSFDGSAYVNQWYMNEALYSTETPNINGGNPVPTDNYNNLRIGDCLLSGPSSFDGWLQCWGFVNNSLGLTDFDSLQSLCSA